MALAHNDVCTQAFRLRDRAWAVQFHPEVTPAIVEFWAYDYESDPDAVAMGFDPEAHVALAATRLPEWMDLGRRLFDAFLTAASAVPVAQAPAAAGAPAPPPPRG